MTLHSFYVFSYAGMILGLVAIVIGGIALGRGKIDPNVYMKKVVMFAVLCLLMAALIWSARSLGIEL
ncbi:hypothetical protein [Xanthomonas axonopodis]|uniref:hypothetical protein n=1 Tax=Xanthomonas axonopodis TaxID=53413 RepID=UPI00355683D8